MTSLNKESINGTFGANVEPLKYNRFKKGITGGIVHFGLGNFHRSHQAMYLDRIFASIENETEWGVVGVGMLPADIPIRDAMKEQDCLYTLHEKAPDGATNIRVMQAMVEYIYAPDNYETVVQRLLDPKIKIVSLTITEGGYILNNRGEFIQDHPTVKEDLVNPSLPHSTFGIIIEALSRRRAANQGKDGNAFTIMSCDNLRHNGTQAKTACLSFAKLRDPELAKWIERNVPFPSCMVDRITPAMNPDLRASLNAKSGINDKIPVVSEDFVQWVLEDKFGYGRPPFEKVGVTMTDNVEPYEEAKIRLLNGAHTMVSYPAFLSGHRKVDEALHDPLFKDFLQGFMNEDAGPWLSNLPGMDLDSYKGILLSRFGNAAIGDQLSRLCLDGGSKIPGFLLPTIKANLNKKGTCHRIAYLLACYNHYIHAQKDDNGQTFELREPSTWPILEPIIASKDPLTLLKDTHYVADASDSPQFVKDYLLCYEHISKGIKEGGGARKTLENLETILGGK